MIRVMPERKRFFLLMSSLISAVEKDKPAIFTFFQRYDSCDICGQSQCLRRLLRHIQGEGVEGKIIFLFSFYMHNTFSIKCSILFKGNFQIISCIIFSVLIEGALSLTCSLILLHGVRTVSRPVSRSEIISLDTQHAFLKEIEFSTKKTFF